MKRSAVITEDARVYGQTDEGMTDVEKIMLFTTKTCPNCRIATAVLEKCGIAYTKVDAEENVSLTESYGVCQAPTLVVVTSDGFKTYAGAGEIKKFAESAKTA